MMVAGSTTETGESSRVESCTSICVIFPTSRDSNRRGVRLKATDTNSGRCRSEAVIRASHLKEANSENTRVMPLLTKTKISKNGSDCLHAYL